MKLFLKTIRIVTCLELSILLCFFIVVSIKRNSSPKKGEESIFEKNGYTVTRYEKDKICSFYLFAPDQNRVFFVDMGFALFDEYQSEIRLLGENENQSFWISIIKSDYANVVETKK